MQMFAIKFSHYEIHKFVKIRILAKFLKKTLKKNFNLKLIANESLANITMKLKISIFSIDISVSWTEI